MSAGNRARLIARGRPIDIEAGPLLMGIVNATPDSFSDAGLFPTLSRQIDNALALAADGADLLDVGGESASAATPQLSPDEEIARVVPLIEAIAGRTDVPLSIDTYKPDVARAAIAAGASIVNDISMLGDVHLAQVCAETGAALVIMHNGGVPKQRLLDVDLYDDVVGDVVAALRRAIGVALQQGVSRDQIIIDPGPDFGKTPAQTVALLRDLDALHALRRPLLLPISRKDFIGALTMRSPRQRWAGTLAALDHGLTQGAHIFRVHDVALAREYMDARALLRAE